MIVRFFRLSLATDEENRIFALTTTECSSRRSHLSDIDYNNIISPQQHDSDSHALCSCRKHNGANTPLGRTGSKQAKDYGNSI